MKRVHWTGLTLWRAGLLIAGGYGAYYALRRMLGFADPQLEFAVAVGLVGLLFVLLSVAWEQWADARAEGDISE